MHRGKVVAFVWCMIVVPFWFLSPHVVVIELANVEMVLPNLSWKQNGYDNIAVTVASRTAVFVVVVVVCFGVVVGMIAVMVVE